MTPQTRLEATLSEVERRLRGEPTSFGLRFDRARLYQFLGRPAEAKVAYAKLLADHPSSVATLTALGECFLDENDRPMARAMFDAALVHGPRDASAHASLATLNLLEGNVQQARRLYETALHLDPMCATAHHGLAQLAEAAGDPASAAEHRTRGLRLRPITVDRFAGTGTPLRLLTLTTASQDNVALVHMLDPATFSVATAVVDYLEPDVALPAHDVVMNLIGEADACVQALTAAAAIVDRTAAPVVNHPVVVLATGRAANARRLGALAGVIAPQTALISRADLARPSAARTLAERGFVFPLLIRSPGFHTGDHFCKVDTPADLASALTELPGDELFVIAFIDLADPTGSVTKYRVIIVDNVLYPLHVAIASAWKVHYFSADMAIDGAYRARDSAFLNDMEGTIGRPALDALARIRDVLGLDYGGIDFGIDRAGNVVVFEANALMIVPQPDADPRWDYRREPVARIHRAVRRMLTERSSRTRARADHA